MAGAFFAENVHRKPFVFGTVFVNNALRYADHLKFGYARFKASDNFVRCEFYYSEPFLNAGEFVFALYFAEVYHYVVAFYDFRFRERIFKTFVYGKSALYIRA